MEPIRYLDTGPGLRKADASSAVRATLAAGELAASASEAVGEVVLGIKRQKEAGEIATMRANWTEEAGQFDAELMTRQDPENWLKDWNAKEREMRAAITEQKWLPETKQRELERLDSWSAQRTASLGKRAAVRVREEGLTRGSNALEYFAGRGEMDAYRETAGMMREQGLISDAQLEEVMREGERKAAIYGLESRILEDPRAALAEIEGDGFLDRHAELSRSDQDRLQRAAETGLARKQRETVEELGTKLETGKIKSREELERQLEGSDLDPLMRDEMLFHYEQSTPVPTGTKFALTDTLNALHDEFQAGRMTREEYRLAHDSVGQAVFALGARDGTGGLRQRLHQLDPAKWNDGGKLQETHDGRKSRAVSKLGSTFEAQGAFGEIAEDLEGGEAAFAAKRIDDKREAFEARLMEIEPLENGTLPEDEVRRAYLDTIVEDILPDPLEVSGVVLDQAGRLKPAVEAEMRRRSGVEDRLPAEVQQRLLDARRESDPKGASASISDKPVGGNLLEMVAHFEAGGEADGFHRQAYWDYGQWSIGYGTKSRPGEKITKAEAQARLKTELASHRERVVMEAARSGLDLEAHELDALTSFDYNTGSIRQLLKGGSRSKQEIASAMLLYHKAGGKPLTGLRRRRRAEAELFRYGYGDDGAG